MSCLTCYDLCGVPYSLYGIYEYTSVIHVIYRRMSSTLTYVIYHTVCMADHINQKSPICTQKSPACTQTSPMCTAKSPTCTVGLYGRSHVRHECIRLFQIWIVRTCSWWAVSYQAYVFASFGNVCSSTWSCMLVGYMCIRLFCIWFFRVYAFMFGSLLSHRCTCLFWDCTYLNTITFARRIHMCSSLLPMHSSLK